MDATTPSVSLQAARAARRIRQVRSLDAALGLVLALLAASGPAGAVPPLVDALPGLDATPGSNPAGFVEAGGTVYFVASDAAHGRELWKSDGTAGGTSMIADLQPGEEGSAPRFGSGTFVSFQGSVYYAGGNGVWRTDGTAAGTERLLWERGYDDGVQAMAVLATRLLVGTYSGLHAGDGTAAGTTRISDLGVSAIFPFGGVALLTAKAPLGSEELWVTDGTAAGTLPLLSASTATRPLSFRQLGPFVLFRAFSALGHELWRTDGTAAGTGLVKDIRSGGSSSTPTSLTTLGSVVFFGATGSSTAGRELWKSDGTEAGTIQVKDINPAAGGSSSPGNLYALGSTLFFMANDGVSGYELWKSDGTEAGTVRVKDINPGSGSSTPFGLTSYGGVLYFVADDGSSGAELWRSDGTEAGTTRVAEIGPGASSGASTTLAPAGLSTGLWLAGNDGASGFELWRSDGTSGGTSLVDDIAGGAGNGRGVGSREMVELRGRYLFVARDATHGEELWSSDGTAGGTALLRDVRPGIGSSGLVHLTRVGPRVFFFADDGTSGVELWSTDGTELGTARVADLVVGAGGVTFPFVGSGPSYRGPIAVDANGQLIFFANAGAGMQVWRSDGTAAGTSQLSTFPTGSIWESCGLGVLGGSAFFVVGVGGAGIEAGIWKTDGTVAGTSRVATCDGGTGASCFVEGPMARMGSKLYFDEFTMGLQLLGTDGTAAGTGPGLPGLDTEYRTGLATRLLYVNEDGVHGRELWTTDGTVAGSTMLADLEPGPEGTDLLGSTARLGSFLYFQASDEAGGSELWRSDGTLTGTGRVVDLKPGTASSHPRCLSTIGSEVYFAADGAGGAGFELWRTNGTAAGTVLVADLQPGEDASSPCEIVALGGKVLFSSWDAATGRELRAVAAASALLYRSGWEEGKTDDWSALVPAVP